MDSGSSRRSGSAHSPHHGQPMAKSEPERSRAGRPHRGQAGRMWNMRTSRAHALRNAGVGS